MKTNESMIDAAIALLEEAGHELPFNELWKQVIERLEISEDQAASLIGRFYTDLSFSSKVAVLKDNFWDLANRHKYDEIHMDVTEYYSEVEDQSGRDDTDIQEDSEYDQSVQGVVVTTTPDDEEAEEEEGQRGESSGETLL